jgi:hypothetical protein
MKPRPLVEIAKEMAEPIGHAKTDALLIETLQSLIYYRTLNPQQRNAVQAIIDNYIAHSSVSPGQRSLFHVEVVEE